MSRSLLRAALPPCIAALAACSSQDGTGPNLTSDENRDATIFLVRESQPAGYMDALYQGTISRDAQGCLRLAGAEPSTVVWPVGYTLEARDGGLYVEDAEGDVVGQVGGAFRIGGGHAPTLDYADGLSAAKQALAASKCPGSYWLAGG